MRAIEVKPDIYWVGVNDRFTQLFEGLWPIGEEGVSYNAYLLRDEKNALIDLAKSIKVDEFFEQIESVIPISKIDYVVINHMEPDHTGVLSVLRKVAPNATVIISDKGAKMLKTFYQIDQNVRVVKDGEQLQLGRKILKFFYTPLVHWPETMMTYEVTERVLFSCDGFGSYGALRGAIFDDECEDKEFYIKEMLRYYVNIVASFSRPVLRAIEKLADLPIEVVAPSHGLVWRAQPQTPIELYREWAEYAEKPSKKGVTLVYGSMYGNTERAMNFVLRGLSKSKLPISVFNVTQTHHSYIIASLWEKRGVVLGAPTYEASLFPPMEDLLRLAQIKHIKNKLVLIFGSYGWSGGAVKRIRELIEPLGWKVFDVHEFNGAPTQNDLEKLQQMAMQFAQNIESAPE